MSAKQTQQAGAEPILPRQRAGGDRRFLLSLVVPTLGRTAELRTLLKELKRNDKTHRDVFEVIVVDQNPDGDTAEEVRKIIAGARHGLLIDHVRTPGDQGASRARNVGLALARGQWVAFPDDDSVYPVDLVASLIQSVHWDQAAIAGVTFRCEVEPGTPARDLRWDREPGPVTIKNVWRRGALAHTFAVETELVRSVGGFDERLGPPISSGEDTELLMRLIKTGQPLAYNPRLVSLHPENLSKTDERGLNKAESYGYGLGRVYATHDRRPWARARVLAAPLVRMLWALAGFEASRARMERAILRGRWRGLRVPISPLWNADQASAHPEADDHARVVSHEAQP